MFIIFSSSIIVLLKTFYIYNITINGTFAFFNPVLTTYNVQFILSRQGLKKANVPFINMIIKGTMIFPKNVVHTFWEALWVIFLGSRGTFYF